MLTAAVLVAWAACGQGAPAAKARAKAEAVWTTLAPEKGGFSVQLPARPVETKREVKLPGGAVSFRVFTTQRRPNAFGVQFGDAKKDIAEIDRRAALDALGNDLATVHRGKVQRSSPTAQAGQPGRDVEIEIPRAVVAGGATVRARLFLVGRRFYAAWALVTNARASATAADVERFLGSFELTPAPGSSPAAGAWKTFGTPERGYTVLMPGTPAETKTPLLDRDGKPIAGHEIVQWQADIGAGVLEVSVAEYPATMRDPDPEKVFDAGRDAYVAKLKWKLVGERSIRLDGHPGRETTLEFAGVAGAPEGLVLKGRFYLVGQRLYKVLAIVPKASASSPEIATFLDSFRLTAARPAWQTFTSADGGYSVLLPGTPKAQTLPLIGPDGKPVTGATRFQQTAIGEHGVYAVAHTDLSAKGDTDPDAIFEQRRERALAAQKGKLIEERTLDLGVHPGREVTFEIASTPTIPYSVLVKYRAILVGRRLYQFSATVPKENAVALADEVRTFLDSFKLTGP